MKLLNWLTTNALFFLLLWFGLIENIFGVKLLFYFMFSLLVGTVTLAITTSRFYHAFQAVKPSVPLWLNLPVEHLVFYCLLVPAHYVLTIFWGWNPTQPVG
jgi:hypothetical protein